MHPDRHLLGFWIYTGTDAWSQAKAVHAPALVLPDQESPDSFIWPVRGYTTLIIRTSPLEAEIQLSLARVLLRAGAKSVAAIKSGPLVDFYSERRNAG